MVKFHRLKSVGVGCMPPKTGLLGTLSAIALGSGIAATSSVAVAQEQRFAELCDWIQVQTSATQLQSIISRLSNNDQECIFDPATGQNYCKACLTLAAERLVTLTATAGGPTANT
jgi:hypothetical protein